MPDVLEIGRADRLSLSRVKIAAIIVIVAHCLIAPPFRRRCKIVDNGDRAIGAGQFDHLDRWPDSQGQDAARKPQGGRGARAAIPLPAPLMVADCQAIAGSICAWLRSFAVSGG